MVRTNGRRGWGIAPSWSATSYRTHYQAPLSESLRDQYHLRDTDYVYGVRIRQLFEFLRSDGFTLPILAITYVMTQLFFTPTDGIHHFFFTKGFSFTVQKGLRNEVMCFCVTVAPAQVSFKIQKKKTLTENVYIFTDKDCDPSTLRGGRTMTSYRNCQTTAKIWS